MTAARRTRRKPANRLMLVDGDIICYTQCTNHDYLKEHCNEKEEYWETLDGKGVLNEIESRIDELMGILQCSDVLMVFGSRDNFRKRIDPQYKAHRKKKKPLGYYAIVEKCEALFPCLSYPSLEADDVLGILQTSPELVNNQETVIVSSDKDMRTLPGLVYNPDKIDQLKPELITPEEAFKFLAMQTLMGDTSDGYKGCPSIGAVGAEKAIAPQMENAMKTADPLSYLFHTTLLPLFLEKGLDKKYALVQCQLARIARAEDIKVLKDDSWKFKPWTPMPLNKLQGGATKRKSRRSNKA